MHIGEGCVSVGELVPYMNPSVNLSMHQMIPSVSSFHKQNVVFAKELRVEKVMSREFSGALEIALA